MMTEPLRQALNSALSGLVWTERDAQRVRRGMQPAPRRRSLRLAVALTLTALLLTTVALATTQTGLWELIRRVQYPDLPPDARSAVVTVAADLSTEDFTISVPETYYDGRTLRLTVTVTPRASRTLLYTNGISTTDPWQKLISMDESDMDPTDARRMKDLFGEFDQVCTVHLQLWGDGQLLSDDPLLFTRNFAFDPESCTLTFLLQCGFREALPRRTFTLKADVSRNENGFLTGTQSAECTLPLEAVCAPQVLVCTEPALFAEAGVRIDRLTLEVLPQDIYYTIDYTILTWRESATRPGEPAIWLRFYRTVPERYGGAERLSSGLHSLAHQRPVGDMRYTLTGVLSRSELLDEYVIGAVDLTRRQLYEVNVLPVHPADAP